MCFKMGNSVFSLVIFASLCLCLQYRTGQAFNMEITPDEVNGLVHNEVNIRCGLDKTDVQVKEIMILELSKNDVPIAILRQNSKLSLGKGLDTKFEAEGVISELVNESFIHLTIFDPQVDHSGSYTCVLYFLDELDLLKEARKSANLTVSNQDMKSAVKFLIEKVSSLETELSSQKNKSIAREAELQGQIIHLTTEQSAQKNYHQDQLEKLKNEFIAREAELKDQLSMLTTEVQEQNNKANTTVLFTALHNTTGDFKVGMVIAFGNVLVNEGGGYNGDTGVFTAPVAGYYSFHLSLNVLRGTYTVVELKTQTGQILTRMIVGEPKWESYSETSCVVKLGEGEQVMPAVEIVYSYVSLYDWKKPSFMNKFYGYLLKPL